MSQVKMYQILKDSRQVTIDDNDLISMEDAAQLSGRPVSAIAGMLDRGRLPWLQKKELDKKVIGERIQRFTLRSAVIELYGLK